jgi:hypothetical protein
VYELSAQPVYGDGGGGDGDGGGGGGMRGPQSMQSLPRGHELNSAPEPPSSQSPSLDQLQFSVQIGQLPHVSGQRVPIVEPCVAWSQYGASIEHVAGVPPTV